jgi:group I intron endonuclease
MANRAMYIGSSVNLANRMIDHLFYGYDSNQHLQFAMTKYGLPCFVFGVLEFSGPEILLPCEQYYLDILFSLPKELRYKFLPTAGSCLGYKHTEYHNAPISASMTGC